MSADDASRLAAEQRARVLIDAQLTAAGWSVRDRGKEQLIGPADVAVREAVMAPGHARVDYLLYVERRVVGVIEAKPEDAPPSGVEWQSAMYATGLPDTDAKRAIVVDGRLPFVFEASGSETHFTNGYDPDPRARRLLSFPRPQALARLARYAAEAPAAPTWPAKVRHQPRMSLPDLPSHLLIRVA